MNKYDLADPAITEKWIHYYEEKGYYVTKVNSKNGNGVKAVHGVIQEACKAKIERDRRRGILNRPIRAMIVGIPNVGKSTFINSYAKKSCTKVGNKPGVTKGKQWIRIGKDVELLDTPGILWPKFDDQEVGLRLAYIGSINDEILTKSELALKFIDFLKINYCNALTDRYNIDIDIQNSENFEILKQIAVARLCLLKGNEPDLDKAAAILFDDFRSGRLGRMTLEEIPE